MFYAALFEVNGGWITVVLILVDIIAFLVKSFFELMSDSLTTIEVEPH